MKTFIFIAVVITCILYVSGLKITFKPFSVSLAKWLEGLAYILMIASVICFRQSAYNQGVNKTVDRVLEIIDQFKKDKK